LEEKEIVSANIEDATDLVELFARVLCTAMDQLARMGLQRSYVDRTDELRTVRGRIRITETLNVLGFKRGKLVCEYDELTHDILPNQILKAILRTMLRGTVQKKVRDLIAEQLRVFHDVSDIRLEASAFSRVVLHRNNRLYGFLMDICQLVWRNLLPTENGGQWRFRSFVQDSKQMGLLFEHFVRNFYRHHRAETGFEVGRELIQWKWLALDGLSRSVLPQMSTDIVLWNVERKILFECKFTAIMKGNQFDCARLISPHLYQLNAYLTHLPCAPRNEICDAVLLYPADGAEYRLRYQSDGHSIQVRTLDLSKDWQTIHNELLLLPGELQMTAAVP
jgi:5-methylcytosine-specific restriction enzyme subunit McrC